MIYKFNEEIGDNDPHWNELDSGTGYNENILEYLEQVLGDRKI